MKDPVCNEYGNSYSKKVYIETLNKNGRTDPITNKPIKTETIYPNINLKKAIERFLDNNPWAYEEVVAWFSKRQFSCRVWSQIIKNSCRDYKN